MNKDRKLIESDSTYEVYNDYVGEMRWCEESEVRELEKYTAALEKRLEDIRVSIHCHDKKFGFSDFTISLTQALNK